MAKLVLRDLDPEVLGRLERRAKTLGMDLQSAAAHLLQSALANGEPTDAVAEPEEPVRPDECLVLEDGLLVYTGSVSSADLDHRTLREERARAHDWGDK